MANSFFSITSQILILTLAFNLIHAKDVFLTFNISYVEGSPDGVYKNSILTVNGQFPGPTIEAEVGDVLQVDVINSIQDGQNVSIHWHGIHQRNSHCEDGTSQITQCPLKIGNTQRYRVPLHQPGTYWYHSHVRSQYTEGLWGALIVHNKPEVYTYDEEILITLNDWYHRSAKENEDWHISPVSRGVPPYPDSGLLNGVGRYPCDYAALQNRTCDPALQTRKVFQVSKDTTYRLRVINTAAVAAFNFSIEGHTLETIEVDGTDVAEPVLVDIVPIAVGQRYSFLVRTNGSLDRYLIRADLRKESLMLLDNVNINKYPEALMGDVTGVLEYKSEANLSTPVVVVTDEPHTYVDTVPPLTTDGLASLNENDLTPHDGVHAPNYFDQEFLLNVDFYEDHENIRRGSFNRTPYVLPDDKPLLMTFLDGEPLPEKAFSLEIGYMNVVQIIINNPFLGPHPFHLHGHSFWVLGTGSWYDGNYDSSRHNLTLTGARRDTVLVQEESWAVIRFIADNPGIWTFHCHIDWHNLSGMALTFIEGREQAMASIKVTEEAKRVCGMWK